QRNQVALDNVVIPINKKHSSKSYLRFISRLEQSNKIRFFERWIINHKLKIKIHKHDTVELISSLEKLFYETRINELKSNIETLNRDLLWYNKDKVIHDLKKLSKEQLFQSVKNHYEKIDVKTL